MDVIAMIKKSSRIKYSHCGEQLNIKEIYSRNKKCRGKSKYLLSVCVMVGKENTIPAKIVCVRNKSNRKDWLAFICTDTTLSEEEIIRIYGKRWHIELFFKTCKSTLNLIGDDMFNFRWVDGIDISLPTLLIVSGVFQYFHEEDVITFIKGCKEKFINGEMIFDATSKSGLIFTNWFIKRTGNKTALMHFGIDNSKVFADKCGVILLEERTFFQAALTMLQNRLKLITKISMKIAEREKQVKILHLKL